MTTESTPSKPKINRGKGISLSSLTQKMSPGGGHNLNPNTAFAELEEKEIQDIQMSLISPDPSQPRKHFDEEKLEQLVRSVEKDGLQQPISVRPHGNGYLIIAGETRYRAHQILGKDKILCIVKSVNDKATLLRLQLSENVHRTDLTPIETAAGIARLAQLLDVRFKDAAQQLFLSKNQIIEYQALVEAPAEVHELQELGITNDRRTLYEAKKLISANPEMGHKVISDLKEAAKDGANMPNVRQTLQAAIKDHKEKGKGAPATEPTAKVAERAPETPARPSTRAVIRSSVREEGGNYKMILTLDDGSTVACGFDERAAKDLMDAFTLVLF